MTGIRFSVAQPWAGRCKKRPNPFGKNSVEMTSRFLDRAHQEDQADEAVSLQHSVSPATSKPVLACRRHFPKCFDVQIESCGSPSHLMGKTVKRAGGLVNLHFLIVQTILCN
jgi:hypothetical protein